MLKNKLWIVALFAALAMVFTGCTQLGEGLGDVESAAPNPIVDGAKYLEISKRVNGWDSIDLRAGKAKNLDNFTEGALHTITIYGGKAVAGKNVYLGNTDDNYSTNWGYIAVKADGTFTITAKVPWAEIASATNNKRISIDAPSAGGPATVYIYEVVINDGTKDIYKLSEDKDIQSSANGSQPIQSDTVGTTWWIKAGTPVVTVIEGGAADPLDVTFDHDNNGKVDRKKVAPGAKLGVLPKEPVKTGYVFDGWYDAATLLVEYTSDTVVIVEGTTTLALKAKWVAAGKGDVAVLSNDTILHVQPNLVAGTDFAGTINTDGTAKYNEQAADYTGGRSKYMFPGAVTADFNVVELTLKSDIDFEITIKAIDNANGLPANTYGDVAKYPPGAGNAYLSLKAGVPLVFQVAIEDLGGKGGIEFERRLKGGEAVLSVVQAVFSKETEYTVTFDGTAQIKATNVQTQKVLAGKKATAPTAPNWYDSNFVKVTDFQGWYLDGKPYDFDKLVEKDIDLESRWAVAYKRTVTLKLGGGTLNDPDDADKLSQEFPTTVSGSGSTNPARSSIVFPAVTGPTGVGSFAGWVDLSVSTPVKYHDGSAVVSGTTDISKDVTLTAVWNTTINVTLGTGTTPNVATSQSLADGGYGDVPNTTFASGKLTIDFVTDFGTGDDDKKDGQNGRRAAFVLLTDAQATLLRNANEISVTVTLDSTTTAAAGSGNYRYGLANKDSFSGWNATNLPDISNYSGTNTATLTKNGQQASAKWDFFIQGYNSATWGNIVINSITFSIW